MVKTILIQCKCGTIINAHDVKCDRCKDKLLKAERKRKTNGTNNQKKLNPATENYDRLARLYEGN